MKEDKTIAGLFGAILITLVWSCAGSSYKQMAISNPQKLISIEDSLLQLRPTAQIVNSIALAHEILGNSAMGRGDYEKAKKHFTNALKLAPNDSLYIYKQLKWQTARGTATFKHRTKSISTKF